MTKETSVPFATSNTPFIEKLRQPYTAYSKIGELRKLHTAAADLIEALDRELQSCDADWRRRGEIIREQREQLKAASPVSETVQKPVSGAGIAMKMKQQRDELADVLRWLDRNGGLGLDVHARITKALDGVPTYEQQLDNIFAAVADVECEDLGRDYTEPSAPSASASETEALQHDIERAVANHAADLSERTETPRLTPAASAPSTTRQKPGETPETDAQARPRVGPGEWIDLVEANFAEGLERSRNLWRQQASDNENKRWAEQQRAEKAEASLDASRSATRNIDAERYRWLRLHFRFANDSMQEIWFDDTINHSALKNQSGDELDRAIDKARDRNARSDGTTKAKP